MSILFNFISARAPSQLRLDQSLMRACFLCSLGHLRRVEMHKHCQWKARLPNSLRCLSVTMPCLMHQPTQMVVLTTLRKRRQLCDNRHQRRSSDAVSLIMQIVIVAVRASLRASIGQHTLIDPSRNCHTDTKTHLSSHP